MLVTLLAGCFAPSAPTGAPCDIDEHCPSAQRCIAGACGVAGAPAVDAPLEGDAAPGDTDADGVSNMADNCPTLANGDQHDEDGDGVGDVCDNCPHLANATQANADGDAVGDACDPRPAMAGDTIARFLSFHVVPQDLSTPVGSWTVTNDTFRNASNFNDAELLVGGVRDKITVEIAGTVENVQGDTWLAISVGERGTPSRFYDCGYYDLPPVNNVPSDYHNGVIEYYDGEGFDLRAGNHQLAQRLGGAFTIRASADSTTNQVRCTAIDARGTASTLDGQATPLAPGLVGVKTFGANLSLRYLIIFGQS